MKKEESNCAGRALVRLIEKGEKKKKKQELDNTISQIKSTIFTDFASINFNDNNKSEENKLNNNDNSEKIKFKLDVKNVSNNVVGPNLSLFSQASMSAVSLNKNQTLYRK